MILPSGGAWPAGQCASCACIVGPETSLHLPEWGGSGSPVGTGVTT